jgi:hypothetical protein
LLLIENLPILLPEMVDELLEWNPRTYESYFNASKLPGRQAALKAYDAIEPGVRAGFNRDVDDLNKMAVAIVEEISKHRKPDGRIDPDDVQDYCAKASEAFRASLDHLAAFINSGTT